MFAGRTQISNLVLIATLLFLGACKQQPPASQTTQTSSPQATPEDVYTTPNTSDVGYDNSRVAADTSKNSTTTNVAGLTAARRPYPTTNEFKRALERLAGQDFATISDAEKSQVIGRILKALGTIEVEGSTIDLKNVRVRGESVIIPGINMNKLPPKFTNDGFSLAFFGACVGAAAQNKAPPPSNNFSFKFYNEGSLAFTIQGPSNDP